MAYGARTHTISGSSATFLATGIPLGAYMESSILWPIGTNGIISDPAWSNAFTSLPIAGTYRFSSRWRINDGSAWTWEFSADTDAVHQVIWVETALTGVTRADTMHSTGNTGVIPNDFPSTDGITLGVTWQVTASNIADPDDFTQLEFIAFDGAVAIASYVYDGAPGNPNFNGIPGVVERFEWLDTSQEACTPINPRQLYIPHKDRLLKTSITDEDIAVSQDHQFDNLKHIERWAEDWMNLADSGDNCRLHIPWKQHSLEEPVTSAAQSFDNWKVMERWGQYIGSGFCGCSCPGTPRPADKCLLRIPWKQHLTDVDPLDEAAWERAGEMEFDNFKTFERWANRYATRECICGS